jgi:hypothetical protein
MYGRDRDRLRARVLDVDLEVVLQVLADAGQVVHDVDAERAQLVGVAHAGELQRCGELMAPPHSTTSPARTARRAATLRVLHADRARASNRIFVTNAGSDVEVGPVLHRVQVGRGGRRPRPVDVAVERREALLALPFTSW